LITIAKIGDKPFQNLIGVNFADFCQKALGDVA
jgi:hypothetical protein